MREEQIGSAREMIGNYKEARIYECLFKNKKKKHTMVGKEERRKRQSKRRSVLMHACMWKSSHCSLSSRGQQDGVKGQDNLSQ